MKKESKTGKKCTAEMHRRPAGLAPDFPSMLFDVGQAMTSTVPDAASTEVPRRITPTDTM